MSIPANCEQRESEPRAQAIHAALHTVNAGRVKVVAQGKGAKKGDSGATQRETPRGRTSERHCCCARLKRIQKPARPHGSAFWRLRAVTAMDSFTWLTPAP